MSVNEPPEDQPTLAELELDAAMLAAMRQIVGRRYDEVRAEIKRRTRPRTTTHPSIPGAADDPDDIVVATVVHSAKVKTLVIDDADEFMQWLDDNYSSEVDDRPRCREAFWKILSSSVSEYGRLRGPNGETDIPGLRVAVGDSRVSVSPEKDALPNLWQWGRGDLLRLIEGRRRAATLMEIEGGAAE